MEPWRPIPLTGFLLRCTEPRPTGPPSVPCCCLGNLNPNCARSTPRSITSGSRDRKSTRLNSSHSQISYAVFCLKKKKEHHRQLEHPQQSLNYQTYESEHHSGE